MTGAVVGVVFAVAVAGLVWYDRSKLKVAVKNAEAKVENIGAAVKADVKAKLAQVVADVKAWDAKAKERNRICYRAG